MTPPLRIVIRGPDWCIGICMELLPHTSLVWWKDFIRLTRFAYDRVEKLQMLLEYLQSPDLEKNYMALIPENGASSSFFHNPAWRDTKHPSKALLNQFQKRLPKIVELIRSSIE